MANTTRASGFLPSIRCSNCNVEIPISMMGDHVCSQGTYPPQWKPLQHTHHTAAPPLPNSRFKRLDGLSAPRALKQTMGAPLSRPQKPIPSRLNKASTCMWQDPLSYTHRTLKLTVACKVDSILQTHQHSPEPIAVNTAPSVSPAIHSNGPKSSFRMPFLRSSTPPIPSRPVSPVLPTPQDCAFPPFPARSQSTTPTTPLESAFNLPLKSDTPQKRVNTAVGDPSFISRPNGSLMQRVNTITPGPFNLREDENYNSSGHRKSPSMGNSRDFVRLSRSASPRQHVQRPSTSSSNYTRNPSLSSIPAGPRSSLDRSKAELPVVPLIRTPSFHDQFDGSAHVPLPSFDFGSFGHEERSPTPPKNEWDGVPSESRLTKDRTRSEPPSRTHKPRPSVAVAAMQPLCDIGSTSSFKPTRSVRGRAISPAVDRTITAQSVKAHTAESRDDRRFGCAPPVPMLVQAGEISGHDNQYHKPQESTSSNESYSSGVKSGSSVSTPHESTSSNESYSFGTKGVSSRSSPPLNDSPKYRNARAADDNQACSMFQGFIFDVGEPSTLKERASMRDEQTAGYTQPSQMNAPAPFRPVNPNYNPHEYAPVRNLSPATSPDEDIVSSLAPHMTNLRVSPTPPAHSRYPEPSARRPSPTNKGNCRGCGHFILGKSVSSADGRLTGRYHKQCFVCQTCQRPFPTADFYVMDNQPYCARHYHELNDSLCTNCDRGIEGQYLETESQQKFHPHCFSCQECHIILRDDYFEFNGKTLCEQHAFGAASISTPSSLGPGRRFPERRTTRLMTM